MEWVGALRTIPADGEERDSRRHSLSLGAQASSNGRVARVVVHNISATGLLIESPLKLNFGEEIEVELPRVEVQRASVVWFSEGFYGCQFTTPLSDATVSAARLRSMPLWHPQPPEASADGDPEGQTADPTALTLRQKAAVIVSLATACWGAIILTTLLLI